MTTRTAGAIVLAATLLAGPAALAAEGALAAPEMIRVPAGAFLMGDDTPGGGPVREVLLSRDFWLGADEVTNAQYLEALRWAVAAELPRNTPTPPFPTATTPPTTPSRTSPGRALRPTATG